ncbi:MAG: MFS transporter [Sphaerochaetaceae bacterium]
MHPALLFIGFFFFAVSYNLLGPLATNLMASTGLSLSQSGSLVSFVQLGSLIAMTLFLTLFKQRSQSTIVRLGYFVMFVALGLVSLLHAHALIFIGFLFLGFASFLIDGGSNAFLSSAYYDKRALYIPLLHFAYSLGAISTGYIIIPFKGEFWYVAYLIVSLVMLTLLIIGLLSYKKRPAEQLHKEERVQAPVLPILKQKPFILYTIVILLYMGSQIICSAWIPVYVESELHQGPAITGTSLTLFWFGIAIARLISGPLLQRGVKPYNLALYGLFLSALSLVGVTQTQNIVLVLLLVWLCGFFAGASIPMYLYVGSTWFPSNTAFVSTSYIFSGAVGRMIFPYLVTVLATYTTMRFALLVSSIMLFVAVLLVMIIKNITRNTLETLYNPT